MKVATSPIIIPMLLRFVSLVTAVAFIQIASQSCIGQGLIPTPKEWLQQTQSFNASSIPVRRVIGGSPTTVQEVVGLLDLPSMVDLTPYCPIPGRQRFNDCTGWAVARGSYSIQIAYSRRRERPSRPVDYFSPRYIYSQVYQANDSGAFLDTDDSNTPSVRRLLSEQGCASEATTPYDDSIPNGFQARPNQEGVIEGKNFTPLFHRRIDSLYDIKRALSQQVPPVVAIQVDRQFVDWTGNGIYRYSGAPVRDPRQKYHAICIVAYDDFRQAIKYPRSATVKARVSSTLLILTRKGFEEMLDQHPQIGIKILKGLAKFLSMNLRKTSSLLADYMLPLS